MLKNKNDWYNRQIFDKNNQGQKRKMWVNITRNEKGNTIIIDRIKNENTKTIITKNSRPLNSKAYKMINFLKQKSNIW